MTDLQCNTGLTQTVEQAGPEKQAQWAWIMASQASPLNMVIDRAEQDKKFAQFWRGAKILDRDNFSTLQYFTPNKTDLAAHSLNIPVPTTDDDDRTIVAMTDFLLNANFLLNNDLDYQVAIPPSWQTDDRKKLLEHTVKHLFYANLSECPDEWNDTTYVTGQFRIAPPDADEQVFLQVTRNLHDYMICPLQENNRDNPAQENLMSMAYCSYQDCLEQHQLKILLASYRQKKPLLPQCSGPAS